MHILQHGSDCHPKGSNQNSNCIATFIGFLSKPKAQWFVLCTTTSIFGNWQNSVHKIPTCRGNKMLFATKSMSVIFFCLAYHQKGHLRNKNKIALDDRNCTVTLKGHNFLKQCWLTYLPIIAFCV